MVDHEQRAGRGDVPADRHLLPRLALRAPRGRVQAQRFLDDGVQERQAAQVAQFRQAAAEYAAQFLREPLLGVGVRGEQVQRETQGAGGRVVPGEQDVLHLVQQLRVRHGLPAVVPRREQHVQQVVVRAALGAALGDQLRHDGVDVVAAPPELTAGGGGHARRERHAVVAPESGQGVVQRA